MSEPSTKSKQSEALTPQHEHFCLPWLWPMCVLEHMAQGDMSCLLGEHFVENELRLSSDVMKFTEEAHKIDYELKPVWATANTVKLDLKTMLLRDFSNGSAKGLPVIIDAPYAGHSATIADYSPDQSLVRALKANGLEHVYVTDWKSATDAMKDFTIDTYLDDLNAAVDVLGGKVHLIGLCQGGWLSAAYAARFPGKVSTLVLAGSPIDADVGEGAVKELAHTLPLSTYRELVTAGGGRLLGKVMLASWKGMNPTDQYIKKYADLFSHIEDKSYVKRAEEFARWYESPLDLPGAYYLQAVEWIFKENRLAKGSFVALGKAISLKDITIPVYMLAGDADDITPAAQVFNAENYLGTPKTDMAKKLVPGGHIGLFMGRKTLENTWPEISKWILSYDRRA
jgi:poly(3-hydroxybutyrate) depolymerase